MALHDTNELFENLLENLKMGELAPVKEIAKAEGEGGTFTEDEVRTKSREAGKCPECGTNLKQSDLADDAFCPKCGFVAEAKVVVPDAQGIWDVVVHYKDAPEESQILDALEKAGIEARATEHMYIVVTVHDESAEEARQQIADALKAGGVVIESMEEAKLEEADDNVRPGEKIVFRSKAEEDLWKEMLLGQISDGAYENMSGSHWQFWSDLPTEVDPNRSRPVVYGHVRAWFPFDKPVDERGLMGAVDQEMLDIVHKTMPNATLEDLRKMLFHIGNATRFSKSNVSEYEADKEAAAQRKSKKPLPKSADSEVPTDAPSGTHAAEESRVQEEVVVTWNQPPENTEMNRTFRDAEEANRFIFNLKKQGIGSKKYIKNESKINEEEPQSPLEGGPEIAPMGEQAPAEPPGLDQAPPPPAEEPEKKEEEKIKKVSKQEAQELLKKLGREDVDIDEFTIGINIELEHGETVDWDLETMGKIALDHMKEFPKYYSKGLVPAEKKLKAEKKDTKEEKPEKTEESNLDEADGSSRVKRLARAAGKYAETLSSLYQQISVLGTEFEESGAKSPEVTEAAEHIFQAINALRKCANAQNPPTEIAPFESKVNEAEKAPEDKLKAPEVGTAEGGRYITREELEKMMLAAYEQAAEKKAEADKKALADHEKEVLTQKPTVESTEDEAVLTEATNVLKGVAKEVGVTAARAEKNWKAVKDSYKKQHKKSEDDLTDSDFKRITGIVKKSLKQGKANEAVDTLKKEVRAATPHESEGKWDWIVTVSKGGKTKMEKVSGNKQLADDLANKMAKEVTENEGSQGAGHMEGRVPDTTKSEEDIKQALEEGFFLKIYIPKGNDPQRFLETVVKSGVPADIAEAFPPEIIHEAVTEVQAAEVVTPEATKASKRAAELMQQGMKTADAIAQAGKETGLSWDAIWAELINLFNEYAKKQGIPPLPSEAKVKESEGNPEDQSNISKTENAPAPAPVGAFKGYFYDSKLTEEMQALGMMAAPQEVPGLAAKGEEVEVNVEFNSEGDVWVYVMKGGKQEKVRFDNEAAAKEAGWLGEAKVEEGKLEDIKASISALRSAVSAIEKGEPLPAGEHLSRPLVVRYLNQKIRDMLNDLTMATPVGGQQEVGVVTREAKEAEGSGLKKATHRVTWWQGPQGTTVSQTFSSKEAAEEEAAKHTEYPDHTRVEPIDEAATVKVDPPKWVPAESMGVWNSCVQAAADKGTLMKAGRIDYGSLVAHYKNKVKAEGKPMSVATKPGEPDRETQPAKDASPNAD